MSFSGTGSPSGKSSGTISVGKINDTYFKGKNYEYTQYCFTNNAFIKQYSNFEGKKGNKLLLLVNLCQKLLFLHQLTHNMTTDCSLDYKFNT